MKLRNHIIPLMLISCSAFSNVKAEPIAVVVNVRAQQEITLEQLNHIFLGRIVTLESGQKLYPLVLSQNNPIHKLFARTVLHKSAAQLKSFWAKQLFTGKGSVPKTARDVDDVQKHLANDKLYIGYLPADLVDDTMHVVYTFDPEI